MSSCFDLLALPFGSDMRVRKLDMFLVFRTLFNTLCTITSETVGNEYGDRDEEQKCRRMVDIVVPIPRPREEAVLHEREDMESSKVVVSGCLRLDVLIAGEDDSSREFEITTGLNDVVRSESSILISSLAEAAGSLTVHFWPTSCTLDRDVRRAAFVWTVSPFTSLPNSSLLHPIPNFATVLLLNSAFSVNKVLLVENFFSWVFP